MKNGYKNKDKIIMDRLRKECSMGIKDAKKKYIHWSKGLLGNPE